MAVANGLFNAKVFHKRLQPKVNAFTYKVYYLCFPLGADITLPILSYNRFNLLSFYDKDHGSRDGSPLLPWIREKLAQFGITAADGEIVMLAHPRVLWHVFNPVSFWFCLDKAGSLRAVLAEVNNTFGERHCYLIAHPDQRVIGPDDIMTGDKVFHVSPFMHVEGSYRYRFAYSEKTVGVWIDYHTDKGEMLKTSLAGKRSDLTTLSLLTAFIVMPFVTLRTIALIHWQALKLWSKRVRYVPKPKPPEKEMSR